MTLCPVALLASCTKCPIVKACPLKEVLGDFERDAGGSEATQPDPEPAAEEDAT